MPKAFARGAARSGAVFLALAALVGAATWPWPRHFAGALPDHWDPPLHAWKLLWNATRIHEGHLLMPVYDANCFYPHACTLCFDDLFWIPSWAAAGLLFFTRNPVLIYNVVSLLFWVLSGSFLYALLRELRLDRRAAFFGAAAFCLLPYRTSYYVEFNMQLCFGIPLLMLFFAKWVKSPSFASAAGVGLAFSAQAVSALYYAVILVFVGPFLALCTWREWLPHLSRRRTWTTALLGLLCAGLCLAYLRPYAELHAKLGMRRTRWEMQDHALEPLSYLLPTLDQKRIAGVKAMSPEMVVFPGFTIAALAAAYAAARRGRAGGDAGRIGAWLRWSLLAAGAAYAVLAAAVSFARTLQPPWTAGAAAALNALALVILLLLVARSLHASSAKTGHNLLRGLAAAAWFCYLISLGPMLTRHGGVPLGENVVLQFLLEHAVVLRSTRVLSRFGIVVLVFLVVAAAHALHQIGRGNPWRRWIWAPCLALVLLESHVTPYRFRTEPTGGPPAAVAQAAAGGEHRAWIVLPIGDRYHDSRCMLSLAGANRLLVNGWSGFQPAFAAGLGNAFQEGRRGDFVDALSELWPDVLVVVDRMRLHALNAGGGHPFTEASLREICPLVSEDERFAVYALPEPKAAAVHRRHVRRDMGRATGTFRYEAHAAVDDTLLVFCNGALTAVHAVTPSWTALEAALPATSMTALKRNTVTVRSASGRAWSIRRDGFFPHGTAPKTDEDHPLLREYRVNGWYDDPVFWKLKVRNQAHPGRDVRIGFARGIRLEGCTPAVAQAQPGERVLMYHYWRCPPTIRPHRYAVSVRFENGDNVFRADYPFLYGIPDTDVQPYPRLFIQEYMIVVPEDAPPGAYRVSIGLYERENGRRLRPVTDLPVENRSAVLPDPLCVLERRNR